MSSTSEVSEISDTSISYLSDTSTSYTSDTSISDYTNSINFKTTDITCECSITNKFIDNIINNYKNLGSKPLVSLLSVNKYPTGELSVMIMYSYLNSHILYEKFVISIKSNNNYVITYYSDYDVKPSYINDLSDIVFKLFTKYYL